MNSETLRLEVINGFIGLSLRDLSVRSRNALTQYLDGDFTFENIDSKILSRLNFRFEKLRNIGGKSVEELESFRAKFEAFLLEISKIDDWSELLLLKKKEALQKKFGIPDVPQPLLESDSGFDLIQFLLSKNVLFKKPTDKMVLKLFRIHSSGDVLTSSAFSKNSKFTDSRVRQIRTKILTDFENAFRFIHDFEFDLIRTYGLKANLDEFILDDTTISRINEKNKTDFTSGFIHYIFSVLLENDFERIGNDEDIFFQISTRPNARHFWKKYHILKKDIAAAFDFTGFADNIYDRTRQRIEADYAIDFDLCLGEFSTKDSSFDFNRIRMIARNMLKVEFGIEPNAASEICFKRNTFKKLNEYLFEALESLDKPATVDEIYEQVTANNPDFNRMKSSFQATMNTHSEFCVIKRRELYGLTKWENEKKNFRGGAIRDIIETYLSKQKMPKHISRITKYVLNFRPTTTKVSVYTNLRGEKTGRFIFFEGGYTGLSSRKYPDSFKRLPDEKEGKFGSWDDNIDAINGFVKAKQRMPYQKTDAPADRKCYEWFLLQIRKIARNELEIEKVKVIQNMDKLYTKRKVKRRTLVNERYDKVEELVRANNRLPSASIPEENILYQFLYHQERDFQKGDMDPEEKLKYIAFQSLLERLDLK